jgi:hypothetical protein
MTGRPLLLLWSIWYQSTVHRVQLFAIGFFVSSWCDFSYSMSFWVVARLQLLMRFITFNVRMDIWITHLILCFTHIPFLDNWIDSVCLCWLFRVLLLLESSHSKSYLNLPIIGALWWGWIYALMFDICSFSWEPNWSSGTSFFGCCSA